MLKLEGNHFISQLPGSLGRRLEATLRLFLITRRVKALITGTVSGVTLLTFCGKVAESPILFRIYRLSTAMFFILLLPALCYSLRFQPKQRRRSPFDSRSIITGFGNALGVIAIVVYDGQASQIVTEILDELLVWGSDFSHQVGGFTFLGSVNSALNYFLPFTIEETSLFQSGTSLLVFFLLFLLGA